jgi:hypothetical protein
VATLPVLEQTARNTRSRHKLEQSPLPRSLLVKGDKSISLLRGYLYDAVPDSSGPCQFDRFYPPTEYFELP